MRTTIAIVVAALIGSASLALPSSAWAGARALSKSHVTIEGQAFRVITYDDHSVKVIIGGVFGPKQSFALRERMRAAVLTVTRCNLADDFWLDAKLIGKLDCDNTNASGKVSD